MSLPVELPNLGSVLARYRFAYLMTTNADTAPVSPVPETMSRGRRTGAPGP